MQARGEKTGNSPGELLLRVCVRVCAHTCVCACARVCVSVCMLVCLVRVSVGSSSECSVRDAVGVGSGDVARKGTSGDSGHVIFIPMESNAWPFPPSCCEEPSLSRAGPVGHGYCLCALERPSSPARWLSGVPAAMHGVRGLPGGSHAAAPPQGCGGAQASAGHRARAQGAGAKRGASPVSPACPLQPS